MPNDVIGFVRVVGGGIAGMQSALECHDQSISILSGAYDDIEMAVEDRLRQRDAGKAFSIPDISF